MFHLQAHCVTTRIEAGASENKCLPRRPAKGGFHPQTHLCLPPGPAPHHSKCCSAEKHHLVHGFHQTLKCFAFSSCCRNYQWALSAHPFANNFLFLILAVSVKVNKSAATVSSPVLPQLSFFPILELLSCCSVSGQLIGALRKGRPSHVHLFSQLSRLAAVTAPRRWWWPKVSGAGVHVPGRLTGLFVPFSAHSATTCCTLLCSRHS